MVINIDIKLMVIKVINVIKVIKVTISDKNGLCMLVYGFDDQW